jgi:hypothetical protein
MPIPICLKVAGGFFLGGEKGGVKGVICMSREADTLTSDVASGNGTVSHDYMLIAL